MSTCRAKPTCGVWTSTNARRFTLQRQRLDNGHWQSMFAFYIDWWLFSITNKSLHRDTLRLLKYCFDMAQIQIRRSAHANHHHFLDDQQFIAITLIIILSPNISPRTSSGTPPSTLLRAQTMFLLSHFFSGRSEGQRPRTETSLERIKTLLRMLKMFSSGPAQTWPPWTTTVAHLSSLLRSFYCLAHFIMRTNKNINIKTYFYRQSWKSYKRKRAEKEAKKWSKSKLRWPCSMVFWITMIDNVQSPVYSIQKIIARTPWVVKGNKSLNLVWFKWGSQRWGILKDFPQSRCNLISHWSREK